MVELIFGRLLIAELPFMLNLPEGDYPISSGGSVITLRVCQEHGALAIGGASYRLVPLSEIPPEHAERVTALRTLLQFRETRSVTPGDVAQAPERELIQAVARQLITDRLTPLAGTELLAKAEADLRALDPVARKALAESVSRRLHAAQLFPVATHQVFVSAINTLVRHYMVEFQDQFAEEVVLHHLASSWTGGVLQVLECDGDLLDSVHYAGKIPPVMKRPWLKHAAERVERLRAVLVSGATPDPIELLVVRAQSFLERGATRSAVIEASAALESAVARRLRSGLLGMGLTPEEAARRLSGTQRFSDRCKALMTEVTGRSLATADPALWQRVVKHRDNYRHKVTHDDSEPPQEAAQQAVHDFAALARIVRDF